MKQSFTIAAAQYDFRRHGDWAGYAACLETWVADGAATGARLLLFPEYAGLDLISTIPGYQQMSLQEQMEALQKLIDPCRKLLISLAGRHDVYILAGSVPVRRNGSYRNTAWFVTPAGQYYGHEKVIMTRFEREVWGVAGGRSSGTVDCSLGRIGVAVCYDSEFPLLVRKLVAAGARLILVPSCTDTLAGYWRVRIAAQARALEGQCYVMQAVTVGEAPWCQAVDVNWGAAGVFGPPDGGFPPDGIVALGTMNQPGWVRADIDLSMVDAARQGGQVLNYRHWSEQYEDF